LIATGRSRKHQLSPDAEASRLALRNANPLGAFIFALSNSSVGQGERAASAESKVLARGGHLCQRQTAAN
jgi:hypothetical protein